MVHISTESDISLRDCHRALSQLGNRRTFITAFKIERIFQVSALKGKIGFLQVWGQSPTLDCLLKLSSAHPETPSPPTGEGWGEGEWKWKALLFLVIITPHPYVSRRMMKASFLSHVLQGSLFHAGESKAAGSILLPKLS